MPGDNLRDDLAAVLSNWSIDDDPARILILADYLIESLKELARTMKETLDG